MGELFCSQPVAPPDAADGAPDEAAAASPKETASGRPKYCGLLVCRRAGAAASPVAGGMAAQGMCGASPLLTQIHVVRQFGTLQHPNNHGRVDQQGGWGLLSSCLCAAAAGEGLSAAQDVLLTPSCFLLCRDPDGALMGHCKRVGHGCTLRCVAGQTLPCIFLSPAHLPAQSRPNAAALTPPGPRRNGAAGADGCLPA